MYTNLQFQVRKQQNNSCGFIDFIIICKGNGELLKYFKYKEGQVAADMKKLDMLYEGKAKKVYKTDVEDVYIVDYKDDATAFNGLKKGTIIGKGVINNKMSNHLFRMLEKEGVPTHYIEELNDRETAVKKVEIVPLEVIVRNVSAGSFAKKLGMEEGIRLKAPTLEFSYKDDALGDPFINDYYAIALGLATRDEINRITELVFKVNDALCRYFASVGIELIDFKVEFGRYKGQIILADEISPDTCRLWDITTHDKLDKDRFRRDLGKVEDAYQEVFKRLGI
jgi:phosphoribosylaminoimidazole-succinocarboxamide synthase